MQNHNVEGGSVPAGLDGSRSRISRRRPQHQGTSPAGTQTSFEEPAEQLQRVILESQSRTPEELEQPQSVPEIGQRRQLLERGRCGGGKTREVGNVPLHERLGDGRHQLWIREFPEGNHLWVRESRPNLRDVQPAVGGGIPIIRPLSESLAGERITRVLGIVNGTTNYILTKMSDEDLAFADAVEEAQVLGFAEADPTADISGADAAAKTAILASLAFGTWVSVDAVYRQGIESLDPIDLRFAADLGYIPKLLAVGEETPSGVSARVHPALIPLDHPLASVRGAHNAVFIEGPQVGELLFMGPGAGGGPTATAVLGDIIDAARELLAEAQVAPRIRFAPGRLRDFGEIETKWYVRLEVADAPGVLAKIAGVFGNADVSIKSVWQEGRGEEATLLLITHDALEANQQTAVAALRSLDVVTEVAATIRVQSDEP